MSDARVPWPVVTDALLTALAIQVVLAIAGHFIGFVGRHYGVVSGIVAGIMGFIFGVWANPTPALTAGAGGLLVTGGSALAGAAIVLIMGDAKAGTLLWNVITAAGIGLITGAIGSVVGRSVFGG
jgi:hypothetical protein